MLGQGPDSAGYGKELGKPENSVDKKDYKWYHNGITLVYSALLHLFPEKTGVFRGKAKEQSDNKW